MTEQVSINEILSLNKDYSERIKKRYITIPLEIWNQKYIHSYSVLIFGRYYKKVEWYLLVSILFTNVEPNFKNVSIFYGKFLNQKSKALRRMFDLNCIDIVSNDSDRLILVLTKTGLDVINEIITIFKHDKNIEKFRLIKSDKPKLL